MIGDKHIRVDLDSKEGGQANDFDATIFIGNLPYVVNEEELRAHFAEVGKILNVRVIRDKDTFIGKGIAYIQFATTEEMKKAVEAKGNSKFKGRDLRVKRATPLERREKKEQKKRMRKEQFKEARKDSKKHRHGKGGEEAEAGEDKDTKRVQPFLDSNRRSFSITNDSVDMTQRIAHRSKKEKLKVAEERLDSRDKKTSRAEGFKNKVLKEQPTLNQMLKTKREKRKKLNMKKYTKIQIKRAK